MEIKVIAKLMSIKDNEVSLFRRDYVTLVEIENGLNDKYLLQKGIVEQFRSEQLDADNINDMLNSRYYLQELRERENALHLSLREVEMQKEAAFETLSNAMTDFKMLEKMHHNRSNDIHSLRLKKEQLESDEIALTMFNKVNN